MVDMTARCSAETWLFFGVTASTDFAAARTHDIESTRAVFGAACRAATSRRLTRTSRRLTRTSRGRTVLRFARRLLAGRGARRLPVLLPERVLAFHLAQRFGGADRI